MYILMLMSLTVFRGQYSSHVPTPSPDRTFCKIVDRLLHSILMLPGDRDMPKF